MAHPLDGCWAKVERSKEHIDALDQYLRTTFGVEANRPRLGIKFDKQVGEYKEYVIYASYVPDFSVIFTRIGVILGDLAHNLRSALDYLTWQLALSYTHGSIKHPTRVQFPIADTDVLFREEAKDHLREVDPAHHAIIERFQPYKGIAEGLTVAAPIGGPVKPYHSFAVMRDLSDLDKHRLLNPVIVPTNSLSGEAKGLAMLALTQPSHFEIEVKPIKLGAPIVRVILAPDIPVREMEMAGYIIPQVTLPEGWPVLQVVEKMAALVVKMLGQFHHFCNHLSRSGSPVVLLKTGGWLVA